MKYSVEEILGRDGAFSYQVAPIVNRWKLVARELVRDVFWDLFRQGAITLGLNDSNQNSPFFRLSPFGRKMLHSQSASRFHDTGSYINLVTHAVNDISPEAVMYLEEAVAAFYADCLLASCVMLGAAAEMEFLRLLETAVSSSTHGAAFVKANKLPTARRKITAFHDALGPLISSGTIPKNSVIEDFETNFTFIQSVIRVARNDAGHPSGALSPTREQVYINFQMFVPLARTMAALRSLLN